MRSIVCRCGYCTDVPGSGLGTAIGTVLLLLKLAGTVLVRFVTGRVLFRPVGPWDATYQDWAPPVPGEVARMRGAGYPRTSWARRPGWQRQAARLLAVLTAVGLLVAPVLTVAALGGAAIAAAGVAFVMTRDRTAAGQARVAPDPWHWQTAVPTAHRSAVPPYPNLYLQPPYVQTPYISTEQTNVQDTPVRLRASVVRLDQPTTREGRW